MRIPLDHDELGPKPIIVAESGRCPPEIYRHGERGSTQISLPAHASTKSTTTTTPTADSLEEMSDCNRTAPGPLGSQSQGDNSSSYTPFRLSNLLPPPSPTPTWKSSIAVAIILGILTHPTKAAFIQFENCLQETYINNDPKPLQWVPAKVDAVFDTIDPRHTLRITMWGNVTGSATNVTLPPGNDTAYWGDPEKLDGKIVNEPEPNVPQPKLTTLHSKVEFLSYEPFANGSDFCGHSLVNASCPLGPVFDVDPSLLPYALPSVQLIQDFNSSYAFGSFSATFLIINGDSRGTNLGCVSATITPDIGDLSWMLKFLPLIILLFVGAATVFAGIWSPWGTADIFHWSSNYGRDPDLLRLVTPGFGDCLQYIQFVALTGGLTLNYPGFYQPIVSQASWSTLMFNQSFVSKEPGWISVRDGIYVTDGEYGLQKLAQLVGMGNVSDIWAGMMVWLMVIIAAMFVLTQAGFAVQWIYRFVKRIPEEDLRAKNIPFTLGNVVRIVLNYFLLPIVALSTFQLVVAGGSPAYTVALAILTLILIIVFAGWLLYLIATTKPRAFLFDDLPTVVLYGPLYNTYSDEAAAFALVPVFLQFLRGIAVGAVQPAGVAQVVLLAICEIVQILTLYAFRPFHSSTSMNAYHTLSCLLRLVTVLMMVAFVPSLGITEGPKGWIGYVILLIHAGVLVLGFFLNAIQTIVEVVARMLGAGGDDIRGQSRGGLSKIFGMRQLSRRTARRETGPSRHSQLSSSAMLEDEANKAGYIMPGGRVRSESAGSMGVFMHDRQRSLSGLDNISLDAPAPSTLTPTTPGEASTFSFLPSPRPGHNPLGMGIQTSDPYYRPPRQRRPTIETSAIPMAAGKNGEWPSQKRLSLVASGGPYNNHNDHPLELDGQIISRSATPAPYSQLGANNNNNTPFTPRTDYSTREVDFYFGVRGQRLNSDAPSRKLGTGPADPTGPMASAAGWFRTMFGGKSKEKGKGFEVVRSARMPPAMRGTPGSGSGSGPGGPGGNVDIFEDESPPEGIPVALGVLRNGPIESDDEEEVRRLRAAREAQAQKQKDGQAQGQTKAGSLLDGATQTRGRGEDETDGTRLGIPRDSNEVRHLSEDGEESTSAPNVPRKSSKRMSVHSSVPSTN